MNLPRRTFLSRILAGAVAAPALTRIIEGSTKPRVEVVRYQTGDLVKAPDGSTWVCTDPNLGDVNWKPVFEDYETDFGTVTTIKWPNL